MRSTCPGMPMSIHHELEQLSIAARLPTSTTRKAINPFMSPKQDQYHSKEQQQYQQHHSNYSSPSIPASTHTTCSNPHSIPKPTMNHHYIHNPVTIQQQAQKINKPKVIPNMLYYATQTQRYPRPVPLHQPPPIPPHAQSYHQIHRQQVVQSSQRENRQPNHYQHQHHVQTESLNLKKYRIENESFRLWSYYKPSSKKLLGRGGYGVVMEAQDTRTGKDVAIKKMKNVFVHLNTAKCSLRELTLMMHFDHPNVCVCVYIQSIHTVQHKPICIYADHQRNRLYDTRSKEHVYIPSSILRNAKNAKHTQNSVLLF